MAFITFLKIYKNIYYLNFFSFKHIIKAVRTQFLNYGANKQMDTSLEVYSSNNYILNSFVFCFFRNIITAI